MNNDLISRNELIRRVCIKFYTTPYYKHILDEIDNAPTVEGFTKDDMTKEYLKGYNACKDMNERPQGDLISREALRKAVEEEGQYLLVRGQGGAEHILVHHCLSLIDNAPTVCGNNPKWCDRCDHRISGKE